MSLVRSQAVLTTPPAGLRPNDVSNEIVDIRPAQSTLVTLLMGLNKVAVDARKFVINEQEIDPGTVTITALAGNNLTFSVADAALIRLGQDLRLNYTVSAFVTAIDYTTGVVGVDDSTGISNGDVLVLGSAATEELSARPTVISRVPVQTENFCETRRDAYGQSRWVETEKYYGGPREVHNREICMWEHKRFIDRGLWYGKKRETTQSGQKIYKTNGVFSSITTNIRGFAASQITWDKMRHNITTDTRFSISPNLWLMCSRLGLELIEKIVRDKTVPMSYSDASQIKVATVGMGNKNLKIFVVDHFEEGLTSAMVLLDPELIEVVTTRNQKSGERQWMMEKPEQQDIGQDGTIGTITTDFGLRLHNEKAHSIWYGAASVGA